ncbi:MAG: cellulase family glycosylhydrolase [Oscillospiraceae bacterium]
MRRTMQRNSKLLALFTALVMTVFVCLDTSFAIGANAQTVLSADNIVEEMGIGWNLGNSLDANGAGSDIWSHETHWGNPRVTEDLIKTVKNKGFNTIRVPVTWYEHITYNNGAYTIDPAWFARVKEVVDYAYNNGMYVILNIHHEKWVNRSDLANSYDAMSAELKQVWKQIAEYFAEYGQRLIFEGMNEPRAEGTAEEWNGCADCYNVINKLNADFINTVRSVESEYRTTRLLMVPGYAASSASSVFSSLDKSLFDDPYVAASVHAYSPYDFTMNNSGDHSTFSSTYKTSLDSIFADIRSFFTQDDIPVVIGEFSASNYGNLSARVEWAEYYMTLAKEMGIPCVLWDNNVEANNGGEAHGYVNRSNNTWYSASESVVDKLISVRNDSSIVWGSKRSYPLYSHAGYSTGTAVTVGGDGNIYMSDLGDFTSGKELAIKYQSSIPPAIALMNSSWGGWTTISPYDYSYIDSYTIAYFRYEDIINTWNSSANGDIYVLKLTELVNYQAFPYIDIKILGKHDHKYDSEWKSDETNHWHECTCGEKSDIAAHTKDSGTVTKQATLTENGTISYKCTVCGAKMADEIVTTSIVGAEVTADKVIVRYKTSVSDDILTADYAFDDVTESLVGYMKSADIQLVISFVNSFTAADNDGILTDAQLKAIDIVLEYDMYK